MITVTTEILKLKTPEDILSMLGKIDDIYEFIGVLARYIAAYDGKCNQYTQWFVSAGNTDAIDIRRTIEYNILNFRGQIGDETKDFINAWIKAIRKDLGSFLQYCLYTILTFDSNYIANETKESDIVLTGPLDLEPVLHIGYRVYEKPPKWFQEDYFIKNKVRHGRNIQDYYCCNSLKEVKNYIFVDEGRLGERKVYIKKYSPPFHEEDKEKEKNKNTNMGKALRVLLCPISNKEWFNMKLIKENKSFRISYSDNGINTAINEKICQVIEYAAKEKAAIVVFPEIASNEMTTEIVKNYVISHPYIKDQVALIFLGTYWNNMRTGGINRGTVISGSGTELLETTKKWKFEYFNKDDETIYIEDLVDTGDQVMFLDIPGWGRLGWEICIEFLRESHNICYLLGANIQVVSSYTSKVDEMESQADSDCSRYGTITAFVNYCIEHEAKRHNNSFFAIPTIKTGKVLACQVLKGIVNCDGNCCIGKTCGYMYTITPNMIYQMQQIGGIEK